jgi:hypothetical protein
VGGLATEFQYLASRRAGRRGLELHVRRYRPPHIDALVSRLPPYWRRWDCCCLCCRSFSPGARSFSSRCS